MPPPPHYTRGYGRLFLEHVTQADQGCDFDFLEHDSRLAGLGWRRQRVNQIDVRPRLRKASRSEGFVMKQLAPSFSAVLRSRGNPRTSRRRRELGVCRGLAKALEAHHYRHSSADSDPARPDPGIRASLILPSTLNVFERLLPVGHNQQLDIVCGYQARLRAGDTHRLDYLPRPESLSLAHPPPNRKPDHTEPITLDTLRRKLFHTKVCV